MNRNVNMMVCGTDIRMCSRSIISLTVNIQRQMSNRVCRSVFRLPACSRSYYLSSRISRLHCTSMGPARSKRISCLSASPQFRSNFSGFCRARDMTSSISLAFKSMVSPRCYRKTRISLSNASHDMSLRLLGQTKASSVKFNMEPASGKQRCLYAGIVMGLLLCFSMTQSSYAEAHEGDSSSHGKKVLTDYSVIGIPGDGRCLFRSVAHGACIRSGKPAPDEQLQKELADNLRARVADEFVKRREETEWFIEGDFDAYVSQIRKSHVWGGEPELLMASHVLQMPITVYMNDRESGGLISIAEYGQEYGKNNPIKVLYHGYGHYDALHIPHDGSARPRL